MPILESRKKMIRKCKSTEFNEILEIINDAAIAYKGIIPSDCWHDPYFNGEELKLGK